MERYSETFKIINIYYEDASSGVNRHPVVKCSYFKDNLEIFKNVHIM